jgi:hypothetical protein
VGIWLSSAPSCSSPSSARCQCVGGGGSSAEAPRTHLADELVDGPVDGIGPEAELCGDALCLLCQSHAARRVSADARVEGAGGRDVVRGPGADGELSVQRTVAGRGCGGGAVSRGLCGREAEELVRQARGD